MISEMATDAGTVEGQQIQFAHSQSGEGPPAADSATSSRKVSLRSIPLPEPVLRPGVQQAAYCRDVFPTRCHTAAGCRYSCVCVLPTYRVSGNRWQQIEHGEKLRG